MQNRDLPSLLGDLNGWHRSDRPFGPWQLARGSVQEMHFRRQQWPQRFFPSRLYFYRDKDRCAAAMATYVNDPDEWDLEMWKRCASLEISYTHFPAWDDGQLTVLTSRSAKQPVVQIF
jgi:hypothetical protein